MIKLTAHVLVLVIGSILLVNDGAESFPIHPSPNSHHSNQKEKQKQKQKEEGRYDVLSRKDTDYRSSNINTALWLQNNSNNSDDNSNELSEPSVQPATITAIDSIIFACQPIVWISLYSVATNGSGLPAGPGGIVGAIEGISYLIVVIFALFPSSLLSTKNTDATTTSNSTATTVTATATTQIISRLTITIGLFVLIGLIFDQGCVPNAKPILDYSAYLPICNT